MSPDIARNAESAPTEHRSPARKPAPVPAPPARIVPERPTRILVADDEHLVATEITLALAELGYTTVGPAIDGDSAVRLAHSALPDMALMDIRMPVRDGLAAAGEIFETLAVPVVILSAYSDKEYVERARQTGIFGYLIKPPTRDQLRVGLEVAWARFADFMAQRAETDQFRRRLEDRKLVERAKWVLVSVKGMTEPDAIRALQKRARDSRTPLATIAAEVIAANDMP